MPSDAAGGTLKMGVSTSNLPAKGGGPRSGQKLVDHGGRVLPASKIYYFWWGNTASWPSDANAGLTALASGLNGTNFMHDIFPQYMRGAGTPTTAFAGSYYDSSAPPTGNPSTSTMVNEACNVIKANGLAANPTATYTILTSNFPSRVNYCAWHSWGTCNGVTIQVTYLPNLTGVSGCNDQIYSCNGYSAGTQAIANVLSHEFSETITDATGSAWYDNSGSEIGDKCAWTFSSCVQLNGSSWQLQREWSNSVTACVQQ
jgi:hypothetical protein